MREGEIILCVGGSRGDIWCEDAWFKENFES
jgi:hypothetical protein